MVNRKDFVINREKTRELEAYCSDTLVFNVGNGTCAVCYSKKGEAGETPPSEADISSKTRLCVATSYNEDSEIFNYDSDNIRECPFRNPKGFPL